MKGYERNQVEEAISRTSGENPLSQVQRYALS